jgi:hypothetical protein
LTRGVDLVSIDFGKVIGTGTRCISGKWGAYIPLEEAVYVRTYYGGNVGVLPSQDSNTCNTEAVDVLPSQEGITRNTEAVGVSFCFRTVLRRRCVLRLRVIV